MCERIEIDSENMHMKIEVVEFYPLEPIKRKTHVKGSLHVYIIDYEMDIRGIAVNRTNKSWFFAMPSFYARDENGNKNGRYPIISFSNQSIHQELNQLIRSEGKIYIEKYLEQL